MIRKLPFFTCLLLSCGPSAETSNTDVSQVSAGALVAYYRDNPRGTAYTDQRVQVRLDPHTYSIEGTNVHFFTGLPGTPPVIVFRCVETPRRHSELIITGVCRGPTRDGIRKADRIAFVIYVDDCRVTH